MPIDLVVSNFKKGINPMTGKRIEAAYYPGHGYEKKKQQQRDALDNIQETGPIDRSAPPPRMGALGGKNKNLSIKYNMAKSRSRSAGRSRRACRGKKLSSCRKAKTCKVVRRKSGRNVCRSASPSKRRTPSRARRGGQMLLEE